MIKNLVITGGLGFIGSNLTNKLHTTNNIEILDNFSRISPTSETPENVNVNNIDVLNFDDIPPFLQSTSKVVHLAAYGSVIESISDPFPNFENNVTGVLNILRASVDSEVKRLIFASTGGALIGNSVPPVNENSLPKPISPYGASKLCGEAYCHAFSKSYGLETVCLRFGNLYGPHSAHKKGAVTMFIKALITDQPIVIYGDGSASRDYIYVDDLCEGIKSALDIPIDGAEVFHLASGRETTVLELAKILSHIAGKPNHPIESRPARRGEVERNFASYDKANETFGFEPKWSLEDGLAKTYEWFESNRDLVLGVNTSDS